jgi:hypothetical protein
MGRGVPTKSSSEVCPHFMHEASCGGGLVDPRSRERERGLIARVSKFRLIIYQDDVF